MFICNLTIFLTMKRVKKNNIGLLMKKKVIKHEKCAKKIFLSEEYWPMIKRRFVFTKKLFMIFTSD